MFNIGHGQSGDGKPWSLEVRSPSVVSSRQVDLSTETSAPQSALPLQPSSASKARLVVYGWIGVLTAALIAYSTTIGFVWDEGFHAVAAQLIAHGKTPYLDFCFPQTPLNAYWNSLWIRLFGENWRVLHVVAVLEITGAMFLAAQWILTRFPIVRWRVPVAIVAVSFVGLNNEVVQFGPIAQSYAIAMLLLTAAFRVAVARPQRARSALLAFVTALLSAGAAASTLLSAPAAAVLFVWFCLKATGLRRLANAAAFVLGAVIPFTPVLWLFVKAPKIVFFNIVQYQAIYRRSDWPGATPHDVDVLSSWLADGQTLLLVLLSAYGLYFLMRERRWSRQVRSQYYLCAYVAAALMLYISTAHPTFARYFIVAVPLIAIIASVGMYAFASRMTDSDRPLWPTAILVAILLLAYGRAIFDQRDAATWGEYERIAKVVHDVTPKNGIIYADELVYFLLRQAPPSGMEFSYSHKVNLSGADEKLYHILSDKDVDKLVADGYFATVETCNDDRMDQMHLDQTFAHKKDIEDCSIFWGWKQRPKK
jgi:hypothetical protein